MRSKPLSVEEATRACRRRRRDGGASPEREIDASHGASRSSQPWSPAASGSVEDPSRLWRSCHVVALFVPIAPSAGAGKGPVRIGLFGDSLAVESEPHFNFLLQAGGKATVSDFAYGGTAACDWLPKMRDYARAEHPRAVVFEFVGNTFTSCMAGCPLGSPAAVHRYCSAVSTAINVFFGLDTRVFLVARRST